MCVDQTGGTASDEASSPIQAFGESGPLDVDSENTDVDSALGDDAESYTTSINSLVFNYRHENGRRYHAYRDGKYLLPNDEMEMDRLDIHHAVILTAMHNKLHLAPLSPDIQRAIDLGTGTGIWAIDFADQYPSAEIMGNDLSPVQPNFVPPNLQFYVDDMEDDWGFENKPFDYVHGRFLAGAILDWPNLLRQAFRNTKPGGWVEFQDWDTRLYSLDGTLTPQHDLHVHHTLTCDSQERRGYNMSPGKHLTKWFEDAGFVNIACHKYILPLGTWPKDPHFKRVGALNFLQMQQSLAGIALATLTRGEGWSVEEVDVLVAKAMQDLKNRRIHGQYDFYVVYGQRPEQQTSSTV